MRTAAALAILLTACTTGSPARPATTAPTHTAAESGSASVVFVRTCDTSVFGDLGGHWQRDALRVGPLFVPSGFSYGSLSPSYLEARDGRGRLLKVLAVIHGERAVDVSIPTSGGRVGALWYDLSGTSPRWVDPTTVAPTVRFEPCKGSSWTQFNGGMVVLGARCLLLTVSSEGRV